MSLFRKKDINQLSAAANNNHNGGLKKEFTVVDLVLIGIGSIVGAGIFATAGEGALKAGPAVSISFIVAGFACLLAAFCYAELATMVPVCGSAYLYTYTTMGEIFAWVIGWSLALEYLFGASVVASAWSGYFCEFLKNNFGLALPEYLTKAPGSIENLVTWFNLPAFVILLFITLLISIGINEFKKVNNLLVLLKLLVLVLIITVGFYFINPDNLQPFNPHGLYNSDGNGIIAAAGNIFFAYIGFDTVASAAEETKNPNRDMPRGILYSLLISTVFYVLIGVVMTGIVYYPDFRLYLGHPIDLVTERIGMNFLQRFVNVGAVLGMIPGMLVYLYSQTRLTFAMSRDGLLPSFFSKLSAKHTTPFISTWVLGIVAAIVAALLPISLLGKLVSVGALFAFTAVAIGVIWLRVKQPDMPRPFRCPGFPYVPIASIVANIIIAWTLGAITWIAFAIWAAVGLVIYFTYSFKNSNLNSNKC